MWPSRRLFAGALGAVALFSIPSKSQAQAQISAIAGATFSTLRGIDGLDSRTGLIGGLSIVLPSSGLIAFQPEILLVSKGAKGENSGPDGLKLNYIEVPLLFRLQLDVGTGVTPHLYAGPYLGYQISCKVEGIDTDCEDVPGVSTKTVDLGGAVGGGLSFDVGGALLTTGVRYSFGVSKVADFDIGNVRESAKNGSFALYAGLGIRLGGR
ncbi:MAG: PorT family protein [Cytophagaceae bacterium]|nr:PorT family protein [Gemmatimonadaceae bacterium]